MVVVAALRLPPAVSAMLRVSRRHQLRLIWDRPGLRPIGQPVHAVARIGDHGAARRGFGPWCRLEFRGVPVRLPERCPDCDGDKACAGGCETGAPAAPDEGSQAPDGLTEGANG